MRDSSGFRIEYTPQLRPHDAGVIELGLIYSDANSIPPRQRAFALDAHVSVDFACYNRLCELQCPTECTSHLPTAGVHIFASQLHAHLTGRKLSTSLWRNGARIADVNHDAHYSAHWQIVRMLPRHIHVKPVGSKFKLVEDQKLDDDAKQSRCHV